MDGSYYTDIFATKGIEYLFIIGFLLALTMFWRVLNKSTCPVPGHRPPNVSSLLPTEWFRLADGFFYHQGHTWAKPDNGEYVTVGLDDFAQKLLGTPDAIHLPKTNSTVHQGDVGWKVQVDAKTIDVLSPVTGTVAAVNSDVLRSPHLLAADPYGKGWLMKIKVPNVKANTRNLLTGKLAQHWMNETVGGLRRRMTGSTAFALQDGGLPISGFARTLSPERWEEVAKEFLLTSH